LKIEPQFIAYIALYNKEDDVLQKIMKSMLTDDIQASDAQKRDVTFRGLVNANKAALSHYDEEVRKAAKRLQIILDAYGNVARMRSNEETSAIYNLNQELREKHAPDVAAVGLNDWINKLEADNNEYAALVKSRNIELSQRSDLTMKDVRKEVDAAYRTIVERIEALMLIEGEEAYLPFVKRLNVTAEKYKNLVAQRQGAAAATKARAAEAAAQSQGETAAQTETKIDPEIEAFGKEAETPKK
jgi:hypothetical protein